MPVTSAVRFASLDRETFRRLDYQVMACAFECQKALGRSCEESLYRNDLAARLSEAGLGAVHWELPVRVEHRGFLKEYRLDLVAADAAIYEVKAARGLTVENEGQLLNYLLMTGVANGKLLNFCGAALESRFVNNAIPDQDRYRFRISQSDWSGPDTLKKALLNVIEDVGLFLETALYNQILMHVLGGAEHCTQRREMWVNGRLVGTQSFQMCADDEAFKITTLTARLQGQEVSLRKLVQMGRLKAFHWVNLNHHFVEFRTLRH